MSEFMQMRIYNKGALYSCECAKCSSTLYCHEWTTCDNNEMRDAMQAGTLHCYVCSIGRADPETFHYHGRQYAGRYSADGYMDCTDWHYNPNLRTLRRELKEMYA